MHYMYFWRSSFRFGETEGPVSWMDLIFPPFFFDLSSRALFYLLDPMISFSVHILHALHKILAIWAAPLSVAPSIAPFSSRMGPKKLLLSGGQSVRRIKYN